MQLCLIPAGYGQAVAIAPDGHISELLHIDILFPVLHGLYGEDGTVQGLAEVARVALAGCGLTGSANALDKDLAKRLFHQAGVPAARSVTITRNAQPTFDDLRHELGLPLFIKPARQGSSVGVNKVSTATDYIRALREGFCYDNKLLAEEFISSREIECAVLENTNGGVFVSRTGEIAPALSHDFYTYDAKYKDSAGAAFTVPADLPPHIEAEIRNLAEKAFRALGCDSIARADFFVTQDMRILINELNTIPGFTDISMYAKVMAASGMRYEQVLDHIITHGLARIKRGS